MSNRLVSIILAGMFIFISTNSWGVLYHTVNGDETLWRIAKKYGTSVEEIRQINGLNGNLIYRGQRLCVRKEAGGQETGGSHQSPVTSHQSAVGSKDSPQCLSSSRQLAASTQQEAGVIHAIDTSMAEHSQDSHLTAVKNTHMVKKGDTLFSIARRNGCSVEDIKRLNYLTDNTIEVAQVLTLPTAKLCQDATPLAEERDVRGDTLSETIPQTDAPVADRETSLAEEVPLAVEEDSEAATDIQFSEHQSDIATQIINTAKRYLYLPYKGGAEIGDTSTDCSGFVKRTFGYFGIKLPRSAREQWHEGSPVTSLREGDLVFFATYASYPSHVGIYIGGDKFIHSSSYRSGGVRIDSLDSPYYHQRYLGARRVVAVE